VSAAADVVEDRAAADVQEGRAAADVQTSSAVPEKPPGGTATPQRDLGR
jgi:hypothetical protein